MTTPTNEPIELRAGDTWEWRRDDLTEYPATTWSLKYRFKNAAGGFEVTAAADGSAFAISVAAATTAGYAAGVYDWYAWVQSGAVQKTVDEGKLTVKPDFRSGAATAAFDARSHARKTLEAIEAVIEKRATLDQQAYAINGRSLQRTPIADLIKLRSIYRLEVKREEAAEAGRNGFTPAGGVFISFRG